MAGKISGEVNLTADGCVYTLRLTIGGMQAIEEYADCSIFDFYTKVFNDVAPRMGHFLTLLAVMLGGKPGDQHAEKQAMALYQNMDTAYLIKAVSDCYLYTLNPQGVPGKH